MTSTTPACPNAAEPQSPEASGWIRRFAGLIPAGGAVLDLACGGGRHSRLLLQLGHPVTAVDRDLTRLGGLDSHDDFSAQCHDLEDGSAFPFSAGSFAGVVVTNYLYRPIIADIVRAVAPGGILLYETFAQGNERFGRPSNPDFLLAPGELLDAAAGQLRVLAYEDLVVERPKPAAVQRICARRELLA
ncbi:bifunctional 2-polyprenyl-6-hydroxyphenol methylase/3-demethylubiquinol 3-O-methyltransferase UbiG [Pelagibius sp. Alg239-R121]|uniref:class I SAM-dependent methyltransferase n=1 Tax=Pelagibius sp. Alg239-R121 TaxID=2993448 RepID=UPI0024A6BAE0|nr:class I SAM-dependent methyltransferase [Pelagibius sp. Alg239-R121]